MAIDVDGVSTAPDAAYERLRTSLFSGAPGWGWEYLGPSRLQPYPAPKPPGNYVSGPDVSRSLQAVDRWKACRRVWRIVITVILLSLAGVSPFLLLIALAYATWAFGPVLLAKSRIASARSTYERAVAVEHQQHEAQVREWDQRRAEFDAHQLAQLRQSPEWYPVWPENRSRVDVFGGKSGWPELTTMMGCTALAAGVAMFVLDMSGDDIAAGVARLAQDTGLTVRQSFLPEDAAAVDLLAGIARADVAELLFDAARDVGSYRGSLEAHHVELLRLVIDRLEGPITIHRILCGLEVLRRTSDPNDESLSATEFAAINSKIDAAGTDPASMDRLSNLISKLGELARLGDKSDGAPYQLNSVGLQVISVAPARSETQLRFTKRLTVLWLIHALSDGATGRLPGLIVLSSADLIGTPTLELLAATAARAQVQLVLQFEHLREDTLPMLGTGHSATIFMRLGNGPEALKAAEHIGKQHTFVLNSITSTHGASTSNQRGSSDSEAYGENDGTGGGPGGRSWSRGMSRTQTWSRSASTTSGTSTSDATTKQRSYDFSVEPTLLQDLERTAFLLVLDRTREGGVVAGDAFPGTILYPRVSPAPASANDRAIRPRREARQRVEEQSRPALAQGVTTVTIVDPTGGMTRGIQALTRLGCRVEWHQDATPLNSGWRVTAPEGSGLDTNQLMQYVHENS